MSLRLGFPFLLAFAACDSSYLEVTPYDDSTIGVGLVSGYGVDFVE